MKRLIAFGCSYTYGEALSDNLNKRRGHPSKYAWPNVLSENLNRQCINIGEPGASNKKICYNIHNFDFRPDDIVVIMWTHLNRSCILHDDPKRIIRLIPSDIDRRGIELPRNGNNNLSKMFYQMFENDFESCYDQYCRANLAKTYLDSQRLINVHLSATENGLQNCQIPKWNQVDIKLFHRYMKIDLAKDKGHPGIESHRVIASEVFKLLQKHSLHYR